MNVLSWLNFIQPASETRVFQSAMVISALLVLIGSLLPLYFRRIRNRFMLEWSREARLSLVTVGLFGLAVSWFSSQRVVVLGARAWYVILAVTVIWRMAMLWSRRKYWTTKEQDEHRKLQQLKYMPGR